MNNISEIEELTDKYVDSLQDDAIPPTLPEPGCPICKGTGVVYTEETHPYGATVATETLWEPCECVWTRATAHAILDALKDDAQTIWQLHALLIGKVEFYNGFDIVYTHKDGKIVAELVDDEGYRVYRCDAAETKISARQKAHEVIDGGFNELA